MKFVATTLLAIVAGCSNEEPPELGETSQASNIPKEELCNARCVEEEVEPGVFKMRCTEINEAPWYGVHPVSRCWMVAQYYAENESLGDKNIKVNRCKWVDGVVGKANCQRYYAGYMLIDKIFANNVYVRPQKSENQRRVSSLLLINAEVQWAEPNRCNQGRLDLTFEWPQCNANGENDGKLKVGGTFAPCLLKSQSIPQAAHVKGELPDWIDTGTNSREKWACLFAIAAAGATVALSPTGLGILAAGLALSAGAATDCMGYLDGDGRSFEKTVPVTNFGGSPLDSVSGNPSTLQVYGFSNGPNFKNARNVETNDIYGPPNRTGINKEDPVEACRRLMTMRWYHHARARAKFFKPNPDPDNTGYVADLGGASYYQDSSRTWHWMTDTPTFTVDADEPCMVNKAKYDAALAAATTDQQRAEIQAYASRVFQYGALDPVALIADAKALRKNHLDCVDKGCVTGSGKNDALGLIETLTDTVRFCPPPEGGGGDVGDGGDNGDIPIDGSGSGSTDGSASGSGSGSFDGSGSGSDWWP